MRKLTKSETDGLNAIDTQSVEATDVIDQIIGRLMHERDAGASSDAEMHRIDELITAQRNLNNASICINNAK